MEALLGLATIIGALLSFGVFAVVFGTDSRDGMRDDWAA